MSTVSYKYTEPKEDHKATKVIFHFVLKTAVEIGHTYIHTQARSDTHRIWTASNYPHIHTHLTQIHKLTDTL